ncbi:uncharacterized protein LOC143035142 isoform X2 [Oratosquilla oratoria]|uniref:uncharacterized protein LOC143035142 isoform X2 n=1 Tax=Oratosquilla oratoria TaxID=337810 RepID=UPI003F75EF11
MQITGASSIMDGDDNAEAYEDAVMLAYYTPQHVAKSPTQSFFSVRTSQDSLDTYHDAFSTLHVANFGSHMGLADDRPCLGEFDGINGTPETACLLSKGPVARVRHASCTNSLSNPPVPLGLPADLSYSTHSLRHSFRNGDSLPASISPHIGRTRFMQHYKRKNQLLPGVNYVPCVEEPSSNGTSEGTIKENGIDSSYSSPHQPSSVSQGCSASVLNQYSSKRDSLLHNHRKTGRSNTPVTRVNISANTTWKNNYVPCVEAERIFGLPSPGVIVVEEHLNTVGASTTASTTATSTVLMSSEVQLQPSHIPSKSNNTVLHTYTFGPVQRRSVGLQRVRDEFKLENLRLHHKAPHLFVSSQWQQHNRMSCLYLGYRLFWALYFLMWAIWAWVGSMGYDAPLSVKGNFLLYMTNWGIWILAVDTCLQAANIICHFHKMADEGDASYLSMPRSMEASWVLSNITGAIHIFITLAYWITVYPNRSDEKLNEIGFNTHVMPALYILLDVAVSATPRRLLHAYQPSLFLTVYTIFNLIYYLCGGVDYLGRSALYPVLDWTRPGMTIGIMGTVILVLIPILHSILCGLYAARVKVWRILKITRYIREEDEVVKVDYPTREQNV